MNLYQLYSYDIHSDAYEDLYALKHRHDGDTTRQLLNQVMADFGITEQDIIESVDLAEAFEDLRGHCLDRRARNVISNLLPDYEEDDSDYRYESWREDRL